MGETLQTQDAKTQSLEDMDPSLPERFRDDVWHEWFARLRKEDPVHYCKDSVNGAYWSVTNHADIKAVDTNHEVFSSEAGGIAIVDPLEGEKGIENFIAMDPPRHDEQRRTVTPSVAPTNLATMEPLIRERVIDILENLPVGETFNWVEHVSIELTARMLATLFDFPYEDRRKLIYWSDLTTNVPQVTGIEVDMQERQAGLQECAMTFFQLWQERAAAEPKFDLISMLAHGEATKDLINETVSVAV